MEDDIPEVAFASQEHKELALTAKNVQKATINQGMARHLNQPAVSDARLGNT
jgi:hypothetical protein